MIELKKFEGPKKISGLIKNIYTSYYTKSTGNIKQYL